MPRISIIIPVYNMHRQLARCLDAVAAQTLAPDEVIVVDDGSADDIALVAGAYGHTPLRVMYMRQEHAGASAARNRGFAESSGEYVMFLDADVVLKKHALERFYDALTQNSKLKTQNMGIGYAYSAFKWGWKKFSSFSFDPVRLKQMPYIHTTSLIKRSILPEKPFAENLTRLQDWDLYLTLHARSYGGVYVPEVMFAVETKGTMSHWLPSVMYQVPLGKFGITIRSLEKYREAEKVVRKKHGL